MNDDQQQRHNGSHEKLVYFPRADGSRIPFKVYSSQEIYRLEQERIFRGPIWSFVAMEAEIAHTNDFKSTFVGDTPVVVARNQDESLSGMDQSLRSPRCDGLPHGARQRTEPYLRLPSVELRHPRQFARSAFPKRC